MRFSMRQAAIQKSGGGNVYIPKAVSSLQLVQSGKGVSSFADVDAVWHTSPACSVPGQDWTLAEENCAGLSMLAETHQHT